MGISNRTVQDRIVPRSAMQQVPSLATSTFFDLRSRCAICGLPPDRPLALATSPCRYSRPEAMSSSMRTHCSTLSTGRVVSSL